jgi:hypothetical protein
MSNYTNWLSDLARRGGVDPMTRWTRDDTTHTNWPQLADHERLAIMAQHPDYSDADMKKGHWRKAEEPRASMPAPDQLLEEVTGTYPQPVPVAGPEFDFDPGPMAKDLVQTMIVTSHKIVRQPEEPDEIVRKLAEQWAAVAGSHADAVPTFTEPTVEDISALVVARVEWLHRCLTELTELEPYRPTLPDGLNPSIPRSGVWLEFGVGNGTSLRIMARERGEAQVFGFDSFNGLPEAWREGHPKGEFACDPPEIEGATIVKGLFEDTLPSFKAPGAITFVHVDCDIYSAASTVLQWLKGQQLAPGCIVEFDELLHYPGWEQHEMLALYEAVQDGLKFRWLGRDGEEKAAIVVEGWEAQQ